MTDNYHTMAVTPLPKRLSTRYLAATLSFPEQGMHRIFRTAILPLLGLPAQSVLDDFARQFTAFQSP